MLDVQRYLPGSVFKGNYAQFEDPDEVALYDKMLHETDPRRHAGRAASIRLLSGALLLIE